MSSGPGFLERNRSAVIAAAATAVLAGGVLYYSWSSTSQPAAEPVKESSPKAASKKNKKKKKSASKKATPLSHGFSTTRDSAGAPLYPEIEDFSKLETLSDKQRKELGDELKTAGNYAFNNKQFNRALELYGQAIKCVATDPIYYSNRAAVYGSIPDYENVVKDATKALELRPDYIKCYSRRGVAYEHLGQYRDAVMDFTAACILSNFEDDNLGKSVDRVLKLQAERVVTERFSDGPATSELPSPSFITAYLTSFHKRKLPEAVVNAQEGTGDYELKLAFDAMDKENLESYKQALQHIKDAISQGLSNAESEALAFEYLGTFKFLLNDMPGALSDINKSLELHPTAQAMIKRSSLNVEAGQLDEAMNDFKKADELDPSCPDIHYQLAQVSFLQQDWPTALSNYDKAIAADDTFLLAQIQSAVTKYRMGQTEVAKRKFQKLIEKHPDNANAHNYYGEILLDLKDVDGAIAQFDKAIELEKTKSTGAIHVLPLINKALAIVQGGTGPSDVEKAVDLCRRAVALDPSSDVAIGTLAQFCLQQGNTAEAIELFERNAALARTRGEQVQAITFAEAAKTQYRISSERPVLRERLEILSRYRG